MALIFADGFDVYTTIAQMQIPKGYNLVIGNSAYLGLSTTGGRYGGGALSNSGNSSLISYVRSNLVTLASAAQKIRIGFHIKMSSGTYTNTGACLYADGVNSGPNSTYRVLQMTNGKFAATMGSGTTIVATGTTIVSDGTWHWVECEFCFNGANSSCTLYVDEVLQFAWTGTSLAAPSSVSVALYGYYMNSPIYDDLIIWDDTGSVFNSFPIKTQRITLLKPNAAGDSTQFTPSSGTNYAAVNGVYGATTNVSDTGTGNTDLYNLADMPYSPASVTAVVSNIYALNPGASTSRLMVPKLKSGGTVQNGAGVALPNAAALVQTPFPLDPSGAAWTGATLNALQAGFGD